MISRSEPGPSGNDWTPEHLREVVSSSSLDPYPTDRPNASGRLLVVPLSNGPQQGSAVRFLPACIKHYANALPDLRRYAIPQPFRDTPRASGRVPVIVVAYVVRCWRTNHEPHPFKPPDPLFKLFDRHICLPYGHAETGLSCTVNLLTSIDRCLPTPLRHKWPRQHSRCNGRHKPAGLGHLHAPGPEVRLEFR